MKLSRIFICGLTVLTVAICLHACGEDDPVNPDPDPTPVVDPDNGEVTFVITNEDGGETGTVDAPAEVAGDTLSMVIRQKSSYTDSDGTVFTCEPEAKFSIHAVMDTVYAQNEELLTQIEGSEVTTSKEGTNPVRNLTKQTIKVGPQSIKAEMLNEVYTYINKAQQAIEMPYAKWNELRAESPSADEGEEDAQQTEADVNITKTVVTLTPLAQTRAIVSDTTLHNVNLRLYGEVEVKNAKDETKQPIVIDVNYIGAVVTSMEVPDPENSSLSYDIEVAKGTGEGTEASPATVSAGDSLRIEINQQSGYSDTDGTKVERNPKASIVLYASEDVVYATSKDELTALVGDGTTKTSKSGENPVCNIIEQTFNIGTKSLYQKADFEVYTYTNKAEKLIELPFVEIEPADAPTVTITEAAGTRAIVNDTAFYDITALTKYKVTSKNVIDAEETSQIIVCAVKYRGAVVTSTEVPDPENSSLSYDIEVAKGTGEGTEASPATVSAGDSLRIEINQQSGYSDTDGTKVERNPKASIVLYASEDVVYATSKDELTALVGDGTTKTSKSGENPVCNIIEQTFNIGTKSLYQKADFEVYTYTNKAEKLIELPFVEIEPADAPTVTITEAAGTRAIVNDTAFYDITALTKYKVTSKNVIDAEETSQIIVCAVKYRGAVVTSTEVPDEDNGEVSFEIEAAGILGEGTAESPYIITPGNALDLVIRQKSRYTDMDWSVFECEPLATINVSLGKDVVYAESLDQLTSLAGEAEVNTSEEGNNPVRHAITQAYNIGGMPIDFALGYEVYPYTTQAGETIEMPYGKLNPASYGGTRTQEASTKYAARISKPVVSAVPQTRATVSDTTMHDITATFNVELESVNAKETTKRTFVFAVTYPAGVITEEEVEEPDLVRVVYRTGYTWEEAHDNLPLLYYATVYRDRYYSNNDVITDTFVDVGHMVSLSASRDPEKAGSYSPEDEISIIYSEQTKNSDDQHLVVQCSLQVSDIEALSTEIGRDEPDPAGNWNEYVISKTYDANSFISASDVPCNQEWGTDNRQQGWYFNDCRFMKRLDVCYQGKETIYRGMCCYNIKMAVYDQFLVIDGRRIDFLEYRPDFNFNLLTKDIPNGIEHTYECRFEFMGRDFYVAVINAITQL